MNKKLVLTSAVAMFVACPAMAAPSHSSNTFPADGKMQEDYTYVGQATQTNLHSYEGPVTASANYEDTPFTVTSGYYLPQSSESVAQCTSGNYCPGINGTVNYSTTTNQGLSACPTGYANSATGASTDTECYRTCDISNVGTSIDNTSVIAHAATLSGNDYYGTGTDTCIPTSCVNGWHLKVGSISGNGLQTAIGNANFENSAYVSNSGVFYEYHRNYPGTDNGMAYYGLSTSEPNTWAMDYGANGMLMGQARCSTTPGTTSGSYPNATFSIETSLMDETGQEGAQYCYCNVTGYTQYGGTKLDVVSPWVFIENKRSGNNCASYCVYGCVRAMEYASSYRTELLGSIAGSVLCEANEISITWDGADQADIDANNAGTVTYGGDIRTPKKAVHVPGKTFTGWTFDTSSGN